MKTFVNRRANTDVPSRVASQYERLTPPRCQFQPQCRPTREPSCQPATTCFLRSCACGCPRRRPHPNRAKGHRMSMGVAPRASRGTDRCYRGARSPDALHRRSAGLCSGLKKTRRTEVPLPPTQHLEEACDEGAQDEVRALGRYVEHPDEPDQRIGHLTNKR